MAASRILLINYEFPPLGGGAGNATQNIARELSKLGTDVRVLTTRFRGQPTMSQLDGYQIHRVRTPRRKEDRSSPFEMLMFILLAVPAALRVTKHWRPDASIAFFGIPSGPVALALKTFRRIPYIVSLRGGDVPGHQPDQLATLHALTRPLIRVIWRHAKAVVANSEGLRSLALRTAKGHDVCVIPNGVDTALFCPPESAPANETPILLYVGRVSEEKGLDDLINALSELKSTAWRLKLIGDGPYMTTLRALITQVGLDDRVDVLGWLPREALIKHYQSADIFTFPSKHEGMPNSVLEAMACGLPVLATRIAGNEELVQDGTNGFLVAPGTPDALSAALTKMLAAPVRLSTLGAESRRIVLQSYNWQRAARDYMRLSQKVDV
jgi:glycosyltransferase involved in cell wall biosynthesis